MNLERANWTLKEGRDWHVAWFRECLKIIDTFTYQSVTGDRNYKYTSNNQATFETGTNLCHYVRVTALWGPGIIFLQLLTVSLVMGAVFFMPLELFGFVGYLTFLSICATLGVLVYGAFLLVDWADSTSAGQKFGDWLDRWIGNPTLRTIQRTQERLLLRNQEGVSIWSMIWTFIVTLKHQVCPLIQIKEDE